MMFRTITLITLIVASANAAVNQSIISPTPTNNTVKLVGDFNPTHYGPPWQVNGNCLNDESVYHYDSTSPGLPKNACGLGADACVFCSASCQQDSDCPQDTPPINKYPGQSSIVCNPVCILQCDTDDECPAGSFCLINQQYSNRNCVYRRSKDCYYIAAVTGTWVSISSSPGNQHVTYQEGTTHSQTGIVSSTWGASATTSASAGFSAFGIDGSASVSGTVSSSISASYSATFSKSETTTYSYDFGPGVVWLWKFTIKTSCESAVSSGHDLELTPNALYPPCCLPGMFTDITKPNGGCLNGTPNLCNLQNDTSKTLK